MCDDKSAVLFSHAVVGTPPFAQGFIGVRKPDSAFREGGSAKIDPASVGTDAGTTCGVPV